MIVAELEAFFSRAIAPTRRVAVGDLRLPGEAAVDAAAVLLGGIAAGFARHLDDDDSFELHRLIRDVELGRRIPQPRLRHRFQVDRIGLQRGSHRLVQDRGGFWHLDLDRHRGTPAQHVLAAVYSARALPSGGRDAALAAVRRGADWNRELGPELIGYLRAGTAGSTMGPAAASSDPVVWAVDVLGLSCLDGRPGRDEVRRAFRDGLRAAHPDHGACHDSAADRIAELDAARRILLA